MSEFFSTRQAAARLGIRPSALYMAVWNTRLDPPAKSPDGAFLWTQADIEHACWALRRRPLEDLDREREQTATGEGATRG